MVSRWRIISLPVTRPNCWDAPKLVEDLVPKVLSLSILQKVLQNLLIEGVHIRDMHSVIETLAEHAVHTQDPNELTALVRIALGRAIVQQLFPGANELSVMTLDNRLERLLMQAMGAGGDGTGSEPGLADTIAQQAGAAAAQQEALGSRRCCWCRGRCGPCCRASCGARCRS